MNADNELTGLLRDVTRERRPTLSDHPSPDELIAYHDGAITEEEKDAIRSHLALCHECTRAVLDLDGFFNAPPRIELSDEKVDHAWTSFRSAASSLLPWRRRSARSAELLVAAALLALNLGLGVLLVQRSGPRTDLHLADLSTFDVRLSHEVEKIELRPPPGAKRLVLVLEVPEIPIFPTYRVRLYALAGGSEKRVWSRDDLVPSADSKLVIDLPRRLFPDTFRIELSSDTDPPELLATYPGYLLSK